MARKKCRSCLSENFKNILSLGEQHLSDFVKTNKKPYKFPLDLVLCNTCYLVQLKHTVPMEFLYTERYGYQSGINNTMKKELKSIVNKSLKKIEPTQKKLLVVDIGANDGTLLSFYSKDIIRVGIEPIKKFAKECKLKTNVVINDFFNYKSYFKKLKNKKADIITAISCFYDIDDPNQFLTDVKKILHKNGIFIIQQNYLGGMLQYNAFDNIVHEHLEYYSLLSLENLLKRHNLEIFDVEISAINGGSFRTYIAHRDKRLIKNSVKKLRQNERSLKLTTIGTYRQFAKRVKKMKEELYYLIKKLVNEKKRVYIYGASTRGNTLLQYCKLNKNLISAAVERNPEKWGKRIASVGIPIISEEQARVEKPDYMLILPWFFKEEFLKREKRYIEGGGHFIFPLPQIEVI